MMTIRTMYIEDVLPGKIVRYVTGHYQAYHRPKIHAYSIKTLCHLSVNGIHTTYVL